MVVQRLVVPKPPIKVKKAHIKRAARELTAAWRAAQKAGAKRV